MTAQKSGNRVMTRVPANTHVSPKAFSLVPLLVGGESISAAARQALRENRVKDAASMIMHDYGLSCLEVGDLLNLRAC
jgi:hypothetical protein